MQVKNKKIVVLGTGGTIAGESSSSDQGLVYAAAQRNIDDILKAVMGRANDWPDALAGYQFDSEQVAQLDSKDMNFETWIALAKRCQYWLEQEEVCALVITHGTDTLEETAFFLSQVVPGNKPIVITCAMRPANFENADGPQNLKDALLVAAHLKGRGVWLVAAGEIHHSHHVQKLHPTRLKAFDSGDMGRAGTIENGMIYETANWQTPLSSQVLDIWACPTAASWPWVEIVLNHVHTNPKQIELLCAAGVQGLIVAGTGNGTISQSMEKSLLLAQASGVKVCISSRCPQGSVVPTEMHAFETTKNLNSVKARVALILNILGLKAMA
jgi:L-asparaginase